jgi:hypothetical protein
MGNEFAILLRKTQVFDQAIKNGFRLPMLTHRSISV